MAIKNCEECPEDGLACQKCFQSFLISEVKTCEFTEKDQESQEEQNIQQQEMIFQEIIEEESDKISQEITIENFDISDSEKQVIQQMQQAQNAGTIGVGLVSTVSIALPQGSSLGY